MVNRLCINCNSSSSIVFLDQPLNIVNLGNAEMSISICKQCGAVFQNPLVSQNFLEKYYTNFSNYTDAGQNFKPTSKKIKIKKALVEFCLKNLPKNEINKKKVFEIGCANGLILNLFKKHGLEVNGIDPSPTCASILKKRYDIDIITGFFEKLSSSKILKSDLIIMSHVLEHVYEPKKSILKCRDFIINNGFLYVEVPLLENEEKFPNGYFTFEHLQYFSKEILINILKNCGFTIIKIKKMQRLYQYPVIAILCKKTDLPTSKEFVNDFTHSSSITNKYLKRQEKMWNKISEKIEKSINLKTRIFVWGGGIHTSQLFHWTKINHKISISNIIDSDPQKHGMTLDQIEIISPDKLSLSKKDTIIISSEKSEKEILNYIKKYFEQDVNVITLYEN